MAKDDKTPHADDAAKPAEVKPPDAAAVKSDQPAAPEPATTVKMVREAPMHKGGPVTADVHSDEVDAWIKAGWTKA